ncbi:MAG: hypothetical protein HY694_13520 [Deltaproteobacteria bacterium]|nr:hypothetical protein [Deltaproteobacteria bacterium]
MGFRIWLGWHGATGHLFVVMERVDDIYINDFEWGKVSGVDFSNHDSSIDFEVDGDHSGGIYIPDNGCCETIKEWAMLADQQAQSYEGIAQLPGGGGPLVNLSSFGIKGLWFLNPPYADGGGKVFGEAPTLSITEFYVTAFDFLDKDSQEKSQPSKLEKDKVIGLRISVGDFDEGDRLTDTRFTPKSKGGLVLPFTRNWGSADFFGDAVLVGMDRAVPEITAVEHTSWARIKASFGE